MNINKIKYLPSNVFLTLEKWDCNHLTIFFFKRDLYTHKKGYQPKRTYILHYNDATKSRATERPQFSSHHPELSLESTSAFCNIITKYNCHNVNIQLLPIIEIIKTKNKSGCLPAFGSSRR